MSILANATTEVVAQLPNVFGAKAAGAIGAGIVAVGAGLGIGKLASAAFDGMARQPEAADHIKGAMIVAAALIEGVSLFAVVVGLMAVLQG